MQQKIEKNPLQKEQMKNIFCAVWKIYPGMSRTPPTRVGFENFDCLDTSTLTI